MQLNLHLKYVAIFIGVISVFVNTMEEKSLTLHDYIRLYKDSLPEVNILNPGLEPDVIKNARNTMNPLLKNCQTEQDVYNYMKQNYLDARAKMITFLKNGCFLYRRENFAYKVVEQLENFFNNGGSNTLVGNSPQQILKQTVLWNGHCVEQAQLISQINLGMINACADFLGINKDTFIVVEKI